MLACFTTGPVKNSIPIKMLFQNEFNAWLKKQNSFTQHWLESSNFKAEVGCHSLIPDAKGKLQSIIYIVTAPKNIWSVGNFPLSLPEGVYELMVSATDYSDYALGWGLGAYQFSRYKKIKREPAQLYLPPELANSVVNKVESIYFVRNLINTPTDDLGPSEFADVIQKFAKKFDASFKKIVGANLLKQNYPAIYAVGRASDDEPCLVDLRWGNKKHPKITLVGKGVCFDTGGLDLKPSSAMLLMKKDMGGAAHVLGLAKMIMQVKLPVQLRVLIPLVENSVSGNAYRPGDIVNSRKGLTIEIGNTDAEGRVILADALTEAVSENPELIIDIATLTGAARVALGTELPAMFCNRDDLAHDILRESDLAFDPMWRLPLYAAYRDSLNSTIADINNASTDSYGGAITAALFLKEFVPSDIPWVHFDLMAWNLRAKPGRPQGGEAMVIRALFRYLQSRFKKV